MPNTDTRGARKAHIGFRVEVEVKERFNELIPAHDKSRWLSDLLKFALDEISKQGFARE